MSTINTELYEGSPIIIQILRQDEDKKAIAEMTIIWPDGIATRYERTYGYVHNPIHAKQIVNRGLLEALDEVKQKGYPNAIIDTNCRYSYASLPDGCAWAADIPWLHEDNESEAE